MNLSSENINCGIIGLGFVGSAIKAAFEKKYNVQTFDISKESTCKTLEILVKKCKIIFICLPTPMNNDGSCNYSAVEDTINQINIISKEFSLARIIAIKSTIPIGTTELFQSEFKNVDIFFNPEFLTEANSVNDFANQNRIILGGGKKSISELSNFYSNIFPNVPIVETNGKTAEMVKYLSNAFLATKVSFANEIYDFCKHISIDYNEVIKYAIFDERLGKTHWKVPGPDGSRGYGGSCFPKDISSLVKQFEDYKISSYIIKSSLKRNNEVDRPDKDWKKLKGRAVAEKNT
tara:strand:- start:4391 stop:5263 length:873 start_codon:yes stop_codon:yes gene_type:complete